MGIDGHFWVEKDGEIIDPYFKQYKIIAMIHDCHSDEIAYKGAPLLTQVWMAGCAGGMLWEGRGFGCCFKNALEIQSKLGGRLVFGSMGFKKKNAPGYHWEYGGPDWKTTADFTHGLDQRELAEHMATAGPECICDWNK